MICDYLSDQGLGEICSENLSTTLPGEARNDALIANCSLCLISPHELQIGFF